MSNLTITNTKQDLAHRAEIGAVANRVASQNTFSDYVSRKSKNTLRNQLNALNRFAEFLGTVGFDGLDGATLQAKPSAWQSVTWGLVEAFVKHQLNNGFAIASVNNQLSAIKVYAKLAHKAGEIPDGEYLRMKAVSGYSLKEGKRVDEKRDITRVGHKKAEHVSISAKDAKQLKAQPNTPQGKRDALLMCLFLDHGLRLGEAARLVVTDFNMGAGELTFYRPKVNKVQTHELTKDTRNALNAYLPHAPAMGNMWRGSNKGGELTGTMSENAISKRVSYLGSLIGYWEMREKQVNKAPKMVKVGTITPHDCRHYWATDAARNGTDPFRLQEAGGWNSLVMPRRYVEVAEIANKGVVLSA